MGAITAPPGTRTAITTTAANSLAAGTFVLLGTIDVSAIDPLDVVIEIQNTPGTVSGGKQALLFLKFSMDGTNYTTGPESGTSVVDESNLRQIGSLPLNTNATPQALGFSVMSALGFVPPFMKVIEKNDSGAAFAASGNSAHFTAYTGNSA